MAVPAAAEEESTNIWASDVDTSEPMELKMYLIGDRTPDFDEVYGKINEILEEKLNCTLSVDFLSWGEHDTKYSLLFSGGEDFDLIFTASSWGHYEQTVALGGFSNPATTSLAPGFPFPALLPFPCPRSSDNKGCRNLLPAVHRIRISASP